MKLFVTGADGFIGSSIAATAFTHQHEVLRLAKPNRMDSLPWAEIADFAPEVCVHSAWIATPGVYGESELNALHRQWAREMVSKMAMLGVKHFVVLGTCGEYGESATPLSEDSSIISPESTYARQKHALHLELQSLQRELQFSLCWARVFFPYGPREHHDRLVTRLFRECKAGVLMGDFLQHPHSVRDYIHVDDVAAAIVMLAEQHYDGTVNVGAGAGVSLETLARMVAEVMNVDFAPPKESNESDRIDIVVSDNCKLRKCGWVPRYDLRSGLKTYRKGTEA